jgi:hypothetical protein
MIYLLLDLAHRGIAWSLRLAFLSNFKRIYLRFYLPTHATFEPDKVSA